MSLVRSLRKSNRGSVQFRAAIMCVAALSVLLARCASPDFPLTCIHSSISSHADPHHKQSFDHEDSQWATVPVTVLGDPPPSISTHAIPAVEPFIGLVTDGLQHSRPPPVS